MKADVSQIDSIIRKDPCIVHSQNVLDDGWTAIHYAAKEGDLDIVKLLICDY